MPHLSRQEVEKVRKAKTEKCEADMLNKKNVVGIAVGEKVKEGKSTGKPAIVIYVTSKLPAASLSDEDVVPAKVDGVDTDVVEIEMPHAQIRTEENSDLYRALPPNELSTRVRPVKGGWSIGHPQITAGTAGAIVINREERTPANYYILSNNHVIANSNNAEIGDPVLQPGTIDGGKAPEDQVARLVRFIPIQFTPDIPAEEHDNVVDAAIAEGSLQELDREVYWSGYVKGWIPKEEMEVGLEVRKTGRTTGYTTGEIISTDATIDVNFGNGRTARFHDQILTTPMSEGGDSGSLVTDMENRAAGLLFAGSPQVTVLNQIENVRDLLEIDFA